MKIAIIVSTKDSAGMNIKERLLETGKLVETVEWKGHTVYEYNNDCHLYTVDTDSINNEDIDKEIQADFFLFATKHSSAAGVQSLSVHSIGNWSKAEFGGRDKTMVFSDGNLLRYSLFLLEELNTLEIEVIQEVTHHGPYLEKPTMFIEIGSNEEGWKNKKAAEILVKAIVKIIKTLQDKLPKFTLAVGVGGLHHSPVFTSLMHRTDLAFSHICPKYNLENLDIEILKEAMEKGKAELVILDWKGLGKEKQRIVAMLEEHNIPFKRSKDL